MTLSPLTKETVDGIELQHVLDSQELKGNARLETSAAHQFRVWPSGY
jgi:hypothetical protein